MNPIIETYFRDIGLEEPQSAEALLEKCYSIGNRQAVDKLLKETDARDDGGAQSNNSFYNKKNADAAVAFAFTGGFDYFYYVGLFDWILHNKDCFGDSILDVGCDIGIVSCFLGWLFPEKHIVSIDKIEKSIRLAEKLAKKLGITNIEFRRTDVKKVAETFDTVFSSRTLHENSMNGIPAVIPDFLACSKTIAEKMTPYANAVTALINEGGTFVTCERQELDPVFLAWVNVLSGCGFNMLAGSHKRIIAKELNKKSEFQAGVYSRVAPSRSVDEIFSDYVSAVGALSNIKDFASDWGTASEWAAELARHLCADQLMEGYYIVDKAGSKNPVGQFALYTNRYDKDSVLTYQRFAPENVRVMNNSFSKHKNNNLESIRRTIQQGKKNGWTIYRINRDENGKESFGSRVL